MVNELHLFFIHPATMHLDFRESRVDLLKIFRRQLNIDCCSILVEVINIACTGNRNNEWLLREQPSQ